MKRDLAKWLKSDDCKELLDIDTQDSSEDILKDFAFESQYDPKMLESLWKAAQKQFLKDLLQDFDDEISELFGTKDVVSREAAQQVSYASQVKVYLHSKYHYLKRKYKGDKK